MEQAVSFFVRPRAGWGLPRLAADVYVQSTGLWQNVFAQEVYQLTLIYTHY